jgi:hypothetical protein
VVRSATLYADEGGLPLGRDGMWLAVRRRSGSVLSRPDRTGPTAGLGRAVLDPDERPSGTAIGATERARAAARDPAASSQGGVLPRSDRASRLTRCRHEEVPDG